MVTEPLTGPSYHVRQPLPPVRIWKWLPFKPESMRTSGIRPSGRRCVHGHQMEDVRADLQLGAGRTLTMAPETLMWRLTGL